MKKDTVHSYLHASPKHMEDMFNSMQEEIDNAEKVFKETGEVVKLSFETKAQYENRKKRSLAEQP